MVERACKTGKPTSVFRALLKKKYPQGKFDMIGEVDRPLRGQVWMRPSIEEEELEEHEGIDVADFDNIEV